ncbi:MAG: PAS domain-containing protein [Pseudomonadota bacterium]|nr:PAS domain-containing protein [Pseudomonadota bacterium]
MTALHESYLNTLPSAVIAADRALKVTLLNPAAEVLLKTSAAQAIGSSLSALPGFDAELCARCESALESREGVSLFEHTLRVPFSHRVVTIHIAPVETQEQLLIVIDKPDRLDRHEVSQWKREVAQAAGVMAAMLAHEVKNPLSGIRGAAQLLKEDVPPEQQGLAELICLETDRISGLLSQMEVFSAARPEKQPVNIHEVLHYVINIAKAGVAQRVTFRERYDPSLPPVAGNRDLLVQLFLNLVKNAAEAMEGRPDATITLTTAWRIGYRLQLEASQERVALPVAVTIEDNGPGMSEAVRERLFEPFVSSREEGRGLGLAIVSKIAADLDIAVELDREFDVGTRFTVWLGAA